VSMHLPDRPAWRCLACDKAWPCVPGKEHLQIEYRNQSAVLAIYMLSQMAAAAPEIGEQVTGSDLYRRFLGWIPGPA